MRKIIHTIERHQTFERQITLIIRRQTYQSHLLTIQNGTTHSHLTQMELL